MTTEPFEPDPPDDLPDEGLLAMIVGRPETWPAPPEIENPMHPTEQSTGPYESIVGRPETWPPETWELDPNLPAPLLESLVPATALVTDPPFTLQVLGQRLGDDAKILFAGKDQPTTFVSVTELTANVDLTGVAAGSVAVSVRSATGLMSNELPFSVN